MTPDPLDVALPYPAPPAARSSGPSGSVEVITAAETLSARTEWVVSGRVRVRRRTVTERRTIEVDVRREVVEVEGVDVDLRDGRLIGTSPAGPPVARPQPSAPFVAVLREQVPRVVLDTRPYERLTVTTELVTGTASVTDVVRHEEVAVDVTPSPRAT